MIVSVADLQKFTRVIEDDDRQKLYVNSATEIVENYLGYGLALTKYVSVLNGNGTNEIQLRARPIKTLLSVAIDGAAVSPAGFETSNEFLVYKNGVFPAGTGNVRAVYWAGFSPSGDADIGGGGVLDGGDSGTEVFAVDLDGGNAVFAESGAVLPETIKGTILRIAALLQTESDGNIGITGKSFAENGSRTFINFTDFNKFLAPVGRWKLIRI